jgi:hypothetical protein
MQTPPRPDAAARATVPVPKVPRAAWAKILASFGIAAVVAAILPHTGSKASGSPPIGTLVLTAIAIGLVTTAGLVSVLRRDLGLPTLTVVYAVLYNGLVVLVKFVLAPHGLYQVDRTQPLQTVIPLSTGPGALLAAALVFGLYLGAYTLIYRLVVRRVSALPSVDPKRQHRTRRLVIALVVLAVLFAGSGGALLIIPLLVAGTGFEYLRFVFASASAGLIALALAGASALAAMTFRSARERAVLAGDVSMVVSLFWVGLAFLALFHALWVVYVLVLTALWPLKVVVPK